MGLVTTSNIKYQSKINFYDQQNVRKCTKEAPMSWANPKAVTTAIRKFLDWTNTSRWVLFWVVNSVSAANRNRHWRCVRHWDRIRYHWVRRLGDCAGPWWTPLGLPKPDLPTVDKIYTEIFAQKFGAAKKRGNKMKAPFLSSFCPSGFRSVVRFSLKNLVPEIIN
jgi:hypothetical protein